MTSSIRQVLVHLDATQGALPRLSAACALAHRHGAAVTALYAMPPSLAEMPYGPELGSGIAATLMEIDEQRRDATRQAFQQFSCEVPVPIWAEATDAPVIRALARQALFADLVVLGQRNPDDPVTSALPPDLAESVVLASGRPALLIPYVGAQRTLGQTVVVAWKDTPEAARALTAALPILQQATAVHVLSWDEEDDDAVVGATLDLGSYLGAHGIGFTWHRGGAAPSALGEVLLSRAFELDADLLVMGCYGHSRAREWVLGGTSRTVLASMTLPVLMAH